jgi:hypothetical protein
MFVIEFIAALAALPKQIISLFGYHFLLLK